MPQTTQPRYLRTAQVAELLQVSPKTVSRWAQEGMLPYVRTGLEVVWKIIHEVVVHGRDSQAVTAAAPSALG